MKYDPLNKTIWQQGVFFFLFRQVKPIICFSLFRALFYLVHTFLSHNPNNKMIYQAVCNQISRFDSLKVANSIMNVGCIQCSSPQLNRAFLQS